MKSTITTRFRCSSPLTDLFEKTLMFLTLILQYLNKLVEGEVRDFTSPKAFHTLKVQRFNRNRIKLLTKFACELPMKVFTLVANFPIQTCELSDTPPPTVRTFNFTRKAFVEGSQLLQRVFQRLRVLFFLTRAQCQISVFHAGFGLGIDQIHSLYYIVCPNAFTCCRQRFKICVGCDYVNPIVSAGITLDCDTTEFAMPLAVLMESIWYFIKSPLTLIPLAECKSNAIIFQRPPRFAWKGDRLELVSLFDFRSATEFLEKPIVCQMDTFQLLLGSLRRQSIPMRCVVFFKSLKCAHIAS